MDILICPDNNYVMQAGVLMCSIFENNKNEDICIHVLVNKEFSTQNKKALKSLTTNYQQTISFYIIDDSLTKNFPVGKDGLPVETYYRLFVTEYIPKSIEKVLYLDCDIIVRQSLKELFLFDISNFPIGCVLDMFSHNLVVYNRLHLQIGTGLINAGVLLLNLTYWRKKNVVDDLTKFIYNNSDRIVGSDQDVLNYVFQNKKYYLPLKYNVQSGFFYKQPQIIWEKEKELQEAINNPAILHYCAADKPWIKSSKVPYRDEFLKYRALTQWKDDKLLVPKGYTLKCVKVFVRNILTRLGLISKSCTLYKEEYLSK